MNRCLHIFILCLCYSAGIAQEYYIKQYRVDAGLPSDIIKGSTQDQLGYFWIATDEGLVKYDGINFTSYREAMHSSYAKGFHTTQDGRLLAFGDLDLIEIKNLGDTVIFEKLYDVSRTSNDSSISYPKTIFEDKDGALWISESQSVVKLQSNSMTRYEFDLTNRTPQFLRSFSFFVDQQQNLYTCSFQGNVFQYDVQADQFRIVEQKFPSNVEFVTVSNNQLLIGSSEGLFYSQLLDGGGFDSPELRFNIPNVSFIAPLQNNHYFITTRESQHYIIELITNSIQPIPASINNVNHVYISRENDMLLSGNEGLIVIRKNLFQNVNKNVTDFIESITEDNGIIYYATSTTLYSYNQSTHENKIVLEIPSGYFQSLHHSKDGIWIANAFQVFLLVDGQIKKSFDFSNIGRFVTAITEDANGNIWLTIPGSNYAYWIDQRHTLQKVKVPLGDEGVINLIRGSTDGIYIASAGPESYLFHKSYEDSVFRNISVPLNINPIGDFNVTDLKFIENEIWLATSNGLMRFDHQTLHHISLGNNFTKLPIKSIQLHPENKLLVANAFGLILLNLENLQFDFFNESSGLLSNTITFRGLFVGNNKTIWVGTAKGLCYSTTSLTELKNTPTPKFTQVFANGGKVSLGNDSEIPYGSFLSVQVSCITFPNEVTLQYRLLPDSIWNFSTASTLTFSGLAAGNYTLEVKAKKNGPFKWSEPAQLGMTIGPPFWHRWWFYLLCLVSGGIVIAITIFGVNTINKRRNLVLQKLVDERTNELRISNEELLNLNHEKNNLIGIVAHDLKNPLAQILSLISLIKVTTTLNEETSHNLELMKQTAERLNILILKILDVDAIESKQMNLNLEPANLSAIVEELTNRFAQEATNKNLTISKQIPADLYALADKNYYEQVLENLLSNAIKFSPQNLKVFVSLHLSGNQVVLEIKDEGPGLSAQDQQKLFGKYQKLSARPTGGETSTGLGLSITKKFVEAMGGKIWCESELNKGASFFVALRQPNELPG